MGTAGPPELSKFLLLREFWTQLGMREDDIARLPAQEVENIIFFMQTIKREEEARSRRANSGR